MANGASFTDCTDSGNTAEDRAPSASTTLTVIRVVPLASAAGFSLSVRAVPEPARSIPVAGTTAGSEETADTVRDPDGVSTSPRTMAIGGVATSSTVDWAGIGRRKGGSFTGRTSMSTETTCESTQPSLTLKVNRSAPWASGLGT